MLKILLFATATEFALKTKSALRLEAKSLSALLGWIQAASWEIGPLTLQLVRALVVAVDRVVAAERGHCALDLLPFRAPLPDPQSSTHHFDCQLHGLSGSFVGEHVAQLWDPTHAVAICWMRIIFLCSLARHFFCSTMRPYSLKTGEHHPLSIHKFHVQGTGFEHPSGVLRCIVTSLRECVKGASMGCSTSHNKYVCHKELTFLSLAAS